MEIRIFFYILICIVWVTIVLYHLYLPKNRCSTHVINLATLVLYIIGYNTYTNLENSILLGINMFRVIYLYHFTSTQVLLSTLFNPDFGKIAKLIAFGYFISWCYLLRLPGV